MMTPTTRMNVLHPFCLRHEQSKGSNSNAGKMDQTWSRMEHLVLILPNHWATERRVLKILYQPTTRFHDNPQAIKWKNRFLEQWSTQGATLGTAQHVPKPNHNNHIHFSENLIFLMKDNWAVHYAVMVHLQWKDEKVPVKFYKTFTYPTHRNLHKLKHANLKYQIISQSWYCI